MKAEKGKVALSSDLSEEDRKRYNRQILFTSFGEEGQKKLRQAHVLIAGVGGLGSSVAIYLTCAGVGRITLVDSDSVELSNLNRQILHWEADIGEKKVLSAARKLRRLNSAVEIIPHSVEITAKNLIELMHGVNLVMDCLDTMETRFILNDGCVRENIPLIHGGIYGLMGEVTTIIPGKTPCFECLFPREIQENRPFPAFGATPALIASIQVMEAIKLLSGFGRLLAGKMLYANGEEMEFTVVACDRNSNCNVCGGGKR
jgi:molybdopterin/thiamine biosynthesis adenylyltransferase